MGDPVDWRGYVARVASVLRMPLPEALAMEWGELLAWHREAEKIDRDTWGLLRAPT